MNSGLPGLAMPQMRVLLRQGSHLWRTTKEFLYPAKKRDTQFTFQTSACWVGAGLPHVLWILLEGQASETRARISGECCAHGCPASHTCHVRRQSQSGDRGPVRGDPGPCHGWTLGPRGRPEPQMSKGCELWVPFPCTQGCCKVCIAALSSEVQASSVH